MVPVAVSVPADVQKPEVTMTFENWAFGTLEGKPRE